MPNSVGDSKQVWKPRSLYFENSNKIYGPFFQMMKIDELADCNRHINCNHQSTDRSIQMGVKTVSLAIFVTYQN